MLEPMHMIVADTVRFGTKINSLKRSEESAERIVFALNFDRGKDTLVLVKEAEGWKVELPIPGSDS